MLASCAPGVGVVGIDNGFGAACVVLRYVTGLERTVARSLAVDGTTAADGSVVSMGWRPPSDGTSITDGTAGCCCDYDQPPQHQQQHRGDTDTVAWFHCFSGIAGDMTLGALIDAGADVDEVRSLCARLPVGGWALEVEPVMRNGIGATKAHVVAETQHGGAHGLAHHWVGARGTSSRSGGPAGVGHVRVAGVAEGKLHRRPPEQVHFHEVGGIDALIDIVGSCAALEVLGIDAVAFSPVATGRGMVRSAHGLIPNPSPAAVELLRGAPTYGVDTGVELTTPTGAALASALSSSWGPMPAMDIDVVGYGAGDAELDLRPNLLQVVVGARAAAMPAGQTVVQFEVNVDDATGETLAHTVTAVLAAGAHDAWITPIVMKKGRPAHTVHALVDPSLARQVAGVLTAETGSFGLRAHTLERWPAARHTDDVEVDGLAVRIKVGPGRAKAEHDDAVRVARRTGRPLREVVSLAEAAWRRDHPDSAGGSNDDTRDHAGSDHDTRRPRHTRNHDTRRHTTRATTTRLITIGPTASAAATATAIPDTVMATTTVIPMATTTPTLATTWRHWGTFMTTMAVPTDPATQVRLTTLTGVATMPADLHR